MTTSNETNRNCKNCGILYSLEYADKHGYTYLLDTQCCSKSCAARLQKGKGCIQPDVGETALREKAKAFISEQGEYCSKDEICKAVKHSCKTFSKHGIKFSELNKELGFDKPKSQFQNRVENVLKDRFNCVETEKSFDGLVGTTGHPLRVDFYISEINTVVEADGSQHKDPNHPWKEWKNGTVAEYDLIKNVFFEDSGIRLVRIPYKRAISESDVLSCLM